MRELSDVEKNIGYVFSDKSLLMQALTHPSADNFANYERMEFLGDAVIELSVSELLYNEFPNDSEGLLTKKRASVVCSKALSGLAKSFDLGRYLILGNGEEQSGGRNKTSILENTFEALCGAVFLDSDYITASSVVGNMFKKAVHADADYKTMLQEEIQKTRDTTIEYVLTGTSGPQHKMIFESVVFINNKEFGSGSGSSKKESEQNAAKAALEKLNHKI